MPVTACYVRRTYSSFADRPPAAAITNNNTAAGREMSNPLQNGYSSAGALLSGNQQKRVSNEEYSTFVLGL